MRRGPEVNRPPAALIDEARCIGCARCLDACPVDAIVGARQQMHTVVESWCIGCGLCLPPCPVDCIDMVPRLGAWNLELKRAAGARARRRVRRLSVQRIVVPVKNRKAVIAAAVARKRPK
jgi:Na+-translocating ferredoxin:NAD+ oxidoreductase subunit B